MAGVKIRRSVRWLYVGGVITAIVIGGAVTYSYSAQPLNVKTAKAQPGTVLDTILATGTVEASQQVDVVARTSGELEDIFVHVGDQVSTDTLLAQFNQDALLLAVKEAEARVAQEEDRYNQLVRRQSAANRQQLTLQVQTAQLQVAKAQAALTGQQVALRDQEAKLSFQISAAEEALHKARQAMYTPGAGADVQAAYARAQAELESLQLAQVKLQSDVELTAAQFDVELAQKQFEAATLAAAQDTVLPSELHMVSLNRIAAEQALAKARSDLAAARVTPRISGVVLTLPVRVGKVMGVGTPLMSLGKVDPAVVRAKVDESMIGRVAMGQSATVTSPALRDEKFLGRVRNISPQATKEGNATIVEVEIEFANPAVKLWPGMTVDASIAVSQRDQVLRVPAAAVRGTRPAQWVWVVNKGAAQKRMVQAGIVGEGFAEVTQGLKEGEEVITSTPDSFRDLSNQTAVSGTEGN